MGVLTKKQILEAQDLRMEEVYVPEWGGSVFVKTLTGAERDWLEGEAITKQGDNIMQNYRNHRARIVVACTVDEKGKSLFSYKDVEELGKKSASALDRIADAAQKFNALTQEDLEAARKNSSPSDQGGGSSSG